MLREKRKHFAATATIRATNPYNGMLFSQAVAPSLGWPNACLARSSPFKAGGARI